MLSENQAKMLDQIYFRNFETAFPRGGLYQLNGKSMRVGSSDLSPLYDLRTIWKFVEYGEDLFLAVFSDIQKQQATYDKIFLDIDDENLERAKMKTQKVVKKLQDHGITEMLIIFSGSKGYHVYIPFKPTKINEYRIAVKAYIDDLGVEGCDPTVIEPSRVSRVPYTKNTKSGYYCVPVSDLYVDGLPKGAVDGIADPVECGVNDIGADIQRWDVDKSDFINDDSFAESKFGTKESEFPACMQEMLNGDSLGNEGRVILGTFLLYVHKGDVEQVVKYFSRWDNFSEYKCRYYLTYLVNNNRKMYRCLKIHSVGLCPFEISKQEEKCMFAPNLNRFADA